MKTTLFLILCFSLTLGLPSKADEDSLQADLCVIEATPAGVACAIRAAREGLSVVLVNRTEHPGGILSSGLGVWDTVWEGSRAPIYDELRQAIFDHYRETYGEDSPQFRHALPGKSGHTNGKFEPRVVESLIREMIAAESGIRLLSGFVPVAAEREGRLIKSISIKEADGELTKKVVASIYADCTYEGDVLPLAKISYRLGRESRKEFGEPHAGVIYMKSTDRRPQSISDEMWEVHESLNLRSFRGFQEIIMPESTGEGDRKVQAFNYRTILTDDSRNQIPMVKPENYDVEFLKTLEYGSIVHPLPNRKIGWNRPQLVGMHQKWAEGNWETRQAIMDAHWEGTMGLLWFLQHDESVPKEKREYWKKLGLAKDEFPDNGHRPYEIYVREARRLDARYILTQHDLAIVSGTMRAPVHADAIAMTDWYADSHAVSGRGNGVRGSLDEGKMMLHAETWPGQIPWRSLLPKGIDNLMVPVCFGASHVAWGAIRLEPTWMQTGEVAGWAAALSKRGRTVPGKLDSELIVRTLVANGQFIGFFNDIDVSQPAPEIVATQYFSTKGFFSGYDARLDEPIRRQVLECWNTGFTDLQNRSLKPAKLAQAVYEAERSEQPTTGMTRGEVLADFWKKLAQP